MRKTKHACPWGLRKKSSDCNLEKKAANQIIKTIVPYKLGQYSCKVSIIVTINRLTNCYESQHHDLQVGYRRGTTDAI